MSTKQPRVVENASLEDRLYTVKYEDPGESHLDVHQSAVCAKSCTENACEEVCPAGVWRVGEDGTPTIAYENCLECGSCRFACPEDNVLWTYPERGSGVTYKRG
jgi:ferredoxin like protein